MKGDCAEAQLLYTAMLLQTLNCLLIVFINETSASKRGVLRVVLHRTIYIKCLKDLVESDSDEHK